MGHSPQYLEHISSPEWRAHANFVHGLTGHRCVVFPFLRSSECHHMGYKRLGHEWVWIDTVPLSFLAHKIIHFYPFWKFAPGRILVNIVLRMLFLVAMILAPIAIILRKWYPPLILAVISFIVWDLFYHQQSWICGYVVALAKPTWISVLNWVEQFKFNT